MPINNFLPFKTPIKLYVAKAENAVHLSFRLSDSATFNEKISITHMNMVVKEWNNGGFVGIETWMGKLWWELRTCGPRPEQIPADFVAISFKNWNFRLTVEFMEELVKEYKKQLAGTLHMDTLNDILAADGIEFVESEDDNPKDEEDKRPAPLPPMSPYQRPTDDFHDLMDESQTVDPVLDSPADEVIEVVDPALDSPAEEIAQPLAFNKDTGAITLS